MLRGRSEEKVLEKVLDLEFKNTCFSLELNLPKPLRLRQYMFAAKSW